MKKNKELKGGYTIKYPGFCDNNPTQCLEMLNNCGGNRSKKLKKLKKSRLISNQKKKGGNTVLSGTKHPEIICPNSKQTIQEIHQFGCLEGSDWSSSLGQNAGVTAQMQADKTNQTGGSSLGFQTYPKYCEGKNNWSQCGINNNNVCSAGGKRKLKK